MTLETWSPLLIPANVSFRIKPMNQRGPSTFSGKTQIGGPDAGYWVARLSGFPIVTPETILEWRGTIGALEGGLADVLISPFDEFQAPAPDGYPPILEGISHSDGSLFSDGSGYSQSTIRVTLAQDLALRATAAVMTIEEAGPIKKGMYFTLDSNPLLFTPRMYMITTHPDIEGDQVSFKFRPPLRMDAKAGEKADFADPRTVMRLADANSGEMELQMGRWAFPSIDLEESWNGL